MLNYNTVTPLLKSVLQTSMAADVFDDFRLVGGPALAIACLYSAQVSSLTEARKIGFKIFINLNTIKL